MAYHALTVILAVSLLLPSLVCSQLDLAGSELQKTHGPYRIVALEDLGGVQVVHTGGKEGEDNVGDMFVFNDELFCQNGCGKGWDTNHKIGTTSGSCVRTVKGKLWHCTATVTFKWGSLMVAGPFSDSGVSTLAVIGGSGCFARAQGTLRAEGMKDKRRVTNWFTIYADPVEDHADGLCKSIPIGKSRSAYGAKLLK